MTAPEMQPPALRAARYRSELGNHGLESATGDPAAGGPDVVFVRGLHAAALCAAYEVAQMLGVSATPGAHAGTPAPGVAGREVRLAVPGGRTAAAMFDALASEPFASRVHWPRLQLFFVDERGVPPTDPESNYRLARERLVDRVGLSPEQVHRMRGDAPDLDAAAREYAALFDRPLDLAVLGIGEDGHFASLFPGSPLLRERAMRVAALHDSPKPPPRRITLTPRTFAEAARVIVVSEGREKRAAAMRALADIGLDSDPPARLLRDRCWIVGD